MTPTRSRLALAVLTLAFSLGVTAAAQQLIAPSDSAPPGARTGVIVGQVVDAVTGAPIPEAVVALTMPKYRGDLPTTPRGRVMADKDGRFFFSDLPPGDYYLRASKEGLTGGTFGLKRPDGERQFVSLAEGQRRTDATLPLWRFAAIGGTVVDEAGEPVVRVAVYAMRRDVVGGRVHFGDTGLDSLGIGPSAMTDDRGIFRISQLKPGRYVIVVPSTQTTMPAYMLGAASQDPNIRREVFGAISETAPPGNPRTETIGEMALLTTSRTTIAPPLSATGRMQIYRTTFFPSASTAAAAKEVAIGAGEERTDVSIGLQPVPTVTVSGRLIAPDGSVPPPMSFRLVGESAADLIDSGFETATGVSDSAGRFTLFGIPAGEYTFKTNSRVEILSRQNLPAFWATQHLSVGAKDLADVSIDLRPAVHLEGRVTYHVTGEARPTRLPPGIVFEPTFGAEQQFAAQYVNDAFSVAAAGMDVVIHPYEANGWFVESVTLDGKDIGETTVNLGSVTSPIIVTYTDQHSTLSGHVKDARGEASSAAEVLIFPTNSAKWTGYGLTPRTVRSVTASATGAYTFDGLPAGDYNLVAIDTSAVSGWMDPKNLEALARQATRVTIAAGASKIIDLTRKEIR